MARWLVRFAYDGAPFAGWARQPGLRTVEGTILDGIPRVGVAPSAALARVEVASRTDRGVSARANALTITTELDGRPLLRALNGIAREIRFTAATPVPPDFRPRRPSWREYRYFLADDLPDLDRWPRLLPRFVGQPIDVRSLARGVEGVRPHYRTIDELELLANPDGRVLRVRARGFLWGMVRKLVAVLEMTASGRISEQELSRGLDGIARLTVPLAPPEGLVLWEVRYDLPWQIGPVPSTRRQLQWERTEQRQAAARMRILRELYSTG